MTLRYGLLGAGVVAGMHLDAISQLEEVELVGIAAYDRDAAETRAHAHGCRAFATNAELLAQKLDVVVVGTPHPSHAELTIAALESGAHVLCEKPLAPEAREADAMIDAADRAGRLLGVCFQQRFRPVIAAAKCLIDEGRLGALVRASVVDPWYRPHAYYASADWRGTWKGEGGGILMNQAPHTLDLLCHLAGPPATAWGLAQRRGQPMEAEDTATALLTYAEGAVGTVAVSTLEPGEQRIELVGDRGRVEIAGEGLRFERFDPPISEHLAAATEMFAAPDRVAEQIELPSGSGDHLALHEDFVASVREGREPRVPAREALWSLELANAIVLSTYEQRAVSLPVDRDAYRALLMRLRGE